MHYRRIATAVAVAVAAAWIGGCGGGPSREPDVVSGRFVGSQACAACHGGADSAVRQADGADLIFAEWLETTHSGAFETLRAIGRETNPICIRCHTTGQGQDTGFVSEEETPHLINVGCESCHGPGGDHVGDPSGHPMSVSFSADLCGRCHQGFHYPYLEQWSESEHAAALETLRSRPFATDACLECHSVDWFLAEGKPVLRQANVAEEPITCVRCHDPHSAEHEGQLRTEVQDICIECHTAGDVLPGQTPHHNQREIFLGIGGFEEDGDPLVGPNSPHPLVIAERCVACHVFQEHPEDPTIENPVKTGHTFLPTNFNACVQPACHPSAADAEQKKDQVQADFDAMAAQIAPFLNANDPKFINRASLSPADQARYDIAKFDYQLAVAGGCRGVHNRAYSMQLLDIALDIFESL